LLTLFEELGFKILNFYKSVCFYGFHYATLVWQLNQPLSDPNARPQEYRTQPIEGKDMKSLLVAAGALASMLTLSNAASAEPTPLWQFDDFKMPESVLYDAQRSQIYVSNVNQGPIDMDGNGSIGRISADGKTHEVEWITGLSSPKGIAQSGKYLYVADVRELVVINLDTAKISARYPVPEAGVLNGIAFSDQGDLYVSDWMGNRIYKLEGSELTVWLETPDLESPNGLVVKDGYLYVASWGAGPKADFSTESSGLLKRISLKSKKIKDLPPGNDWMNLDGLHPMKNGWLASDFMKGELIMLSKKGKRESVTKLAPTAADFWLVEDKDLLLVPYFMGNRVAAYRFES
jgi:sugar lactone lactonase YvrE